MPIKLPLPDQLGHSTVRIECKRKDGTLSTGTGFYFRFLDDGSSHVPVVVTNRHVVEGAFEMRFLIHGLGHSGNLDRDSAIWVELTGFEGLWIVHPDPTVDLCILPIAQLLRRAQGEFKPFYVTLDHSIIPGPEEFDQFVMVEDILMVGYPNGLWDSHNHLPLMRRGITATHPGKNYENREEFVIDAACFPGSSGSPVFLYNPGNYSTNEGNTVLGSRIKLLGILYGGPQVTVQGEIVVADVPTVSVPLSLTRMPFNLGFVIRASRLAAFEDVLALRRGQAPRPVDT